MYSVENVKSSIIWKVQLYQKFNYIKSSIVWKVQLFQRFNYLKSSIIWKAQLFDMMLYKYSVELKLKFSSNN